VQKQVQDRRLISNRRPSPPACRVGCGAGRGGEGAPKTEVVFARVLLSVGARSDATPILCSLSAVFKPQLSVIIDFWPGRFIPSRYSERPLPSAPRPGQKKYDAQRQCQRAVVFERQIRRSEEKQPPRQRDQRWQRIEPNAIGARHFRGASAFTITSGTTMFASSARKSKTRARSFPAQSSSALSPWR